MKASWIERFKFWVCDTFGHANLKYSHYYNNKGVYECRFCGRTETKEDY